MRVRYLNPSPLGHPYAPMKFCSNCGHPVNIRIPAGDTLPRAVCEHCGTVHYENPRVVVGCVPEWQGQILLCRRAIEPRRGYWTAPAGFLEIGESLHTAAARETAEEALAEVEIGSLLSVVNVLHAAQVHVMFRARLRTAQHGAGAESLETGLVRRGATFRGPTSPLPASASPWNAISSIAASSVSACIFTILSARRTERAGLLPCLHWRRALAE